MTGDRASRNGGCGAGEKPAGKRLATDKRHRADTDQEAKGLPPQDGGKERGPDIVQRKHPGACRVEMDLGWSSLPVHGSPRVRGSPP